MTKVGSEQDRIIAFAICIAASGCDRKPSLPTGVSASPDASSDTLPSAATTAADTGPADASSSSLATRDASSPGAITIDFDADAVGAPSAAFEAVVGEWYVADAGGQRGLRVDGTKWQQGTPSASLADQAKRLYGDRYAEFLDGVKAFAFFPLAVYRHDAPRGDFRAQIRFYPEAGRIDQAAGLAFGVAADGSYQGVRANALEDNVLYFTVVKGKRTVLENVRNTPTPSKTWHTLAIEVRGTQLKVELDGTKRLERKLSAAPTGRIGIWSKADSQVLIDDFRVQPF